MWVMESKSSFCRMSVSRSDSSEPKNNKETGLMVTGVLKFDKKGRAWIYAFGVRFMTPLTDDHPAVLQSVDELGAKQWRYWTK